MPEQIVRWEYETVKAPDLYSWAYAGPNDRGAEGWELIAVTGQGLHSTFHLKRPWLTEEHRRVEIRLDCTGPRSRWRARVYRGGKVAGIDRGATYDEAIALAQARIDRLLEASAAAEMQARCEPGGE